MTECTICLNEINSTTGSTVLSCSHTYHLKCIVEWLDKKENCPTCRKKTNEFEKIHRKDAGYFVYSSDVQNVDMYSLSDYERLVAELQNGMVDVYGDDSTEVDLTEPPPVIRTRFTSLDS